MRAYMDAYGLRPLERVRVRRLKMDFRNAISQRGNEARAWPGGHTYVFTSVNMYMLNINKNNPIRPPFPPTATTLSTIRSGDFMHTKFAHSIITQLRITIKNRKKKNSKSLRLGNPLHFRQTGLHLS